MAKRKVRQEWFCTDEVACYFGGLTKTPTGRKRLINNVDDVAASVRDGWSDAIGMKGGVTVQSHTAKFKGKSVTASKSKFKQVCDSERKKSRTPLGFIVAVAPTRAKAKEEGRAQYGPLGGTGHALAVDCEGRVAADTSPEYHKRKKIRSVRVVAVGAWLRNLYLAFTPRTGTTRDRYVVPLYIERFTPLAYFGNLFRRR